MDRQGSVLVVGAGPAGLACALELVRRGAEVRVLDKGRGPGGRLSTRRRGAFHFDHGAQYFTVRDPRFGERVERWRARGVAAPWEGRVVVLDRSGVREPRGTVERLVGVPAMQALAVDLEEERVALGAEPSGCGRRVERLEREGRRWVAQVRDLALPPDAEARREGPFDAVVLALPAPQAAELLAPFPDLADLRARVAAVAMAPCLAALAGFDEPLDLDFDGAFVEEGPLAWIARDGSKPGRDGREAWVLHAGPEYSRANFQGEPSRWARELVDALAPVTGRALPAPVHLDTHRWGFALATEALADGVLTSPDGSLVLAGDWCAGSRVEGAFLSGLAAADVLHAPAPHPGAGGGRTGPSPN